jgi:hypothetical protein
MGGFQCDMSVPAPASLRGALRPGPPVVLVECMAMDAHISICRPVRFFFRSACIAGLVKSRSWREEYSIRQALRSAVLDSLDPSQVETASAAPMAPAI